MKTTQTRSLQRLLLLGFAATVPHWPAVAIAAPQREYTFQAFDVPPELALETSARGINNAGVIVGSYFAVDFKDDGFVFKRGGFTTAAVPGSDLNRGSLFGVNDAGEAVGIFQDAVTEVPYGYVRSPEGEVTVLPDPEQGASATTPVGINNRGTIVGSYLGADDNRHGFILRHGLLTTFDYPGQPRTILTGINDSGTIVGIWISADGVSHGFLLRKGVATPIGVPGAVHTQPFGINNRGQIVGAYFMADNVAHGFLFEKGFYRTLDFPDAANTILRGINDRGVIVGDYNFSTFGLVARPGK
jgi:uncharacterized membrane protein